METVYAIFITGHLADNMASLNEKYSKWDHIEDDEEVDPRVGTRFELGDADKDSLCPVDILYLGEGEIAQCKRLHQDEREIWQIALKKLRVWSAKEFNTSAESAESVESVESPIPCRPYCLFVINLYPFATMMTREIHFPPEIPHSTQEIIRLTVQMIQDPPLGEQRRPKQILFPDRNLANQLAKTLSSLGIECGVLCEAESFRKYVEDFSSLLAAQDVASRADVNVKPGLLSIPFVDVGLLQSFYSAAADFFRAEPWKRLGEKQSLSLRCDDPVEISQNLIIPPGEIYFNILGLVDTVKGMSIAFTLEDMLSRINPQVGRKRLLGLPIFDEKMCERCRKLEDESNPLKRCTRCRVIFYCNQECQRSHWPQHKRLCKTPEERELSVNLSDEVLWWADEECALIFEDMLSVPFDDLDVYDEYKWNIPDPDHGFPVPMKLKKGESVHLCASDIVWIERAMRGILSLLSNHSDFTSVFKATSPFRETEECSVDISCEYATQRLVFKRAFALSTQELQQIIENSQN